MTGALSVSFSLFMPVRHTISRTEYDITVFSQLGQQCYRHWTGEAVNVEGLATASPYRVYPVTNSDFTKIQSPSAP